jgi:hypothetical protein
MTLMRGHLSWNDAGRWHAAHLGDATIAAHSEYAMTQVGSTPHKHGRQITPSHNHTPSRCTMGVYQYYAIVAHNLSHLRAYFYIEVPCDGL